MYPAAALASLPPVDSTSATDAEPIAGSPPGRLGLKPRETAAMLGVSLLVLLAS